MRIVWIIIAATIGVLLGHFQVHAASRFEYIATALLVLKKPGPAPSPTPTPAPAGICDNCNGTGKLGDGTISVPCPVCGGDGRTDVGPPPDLHSVALPPVPEGGDFRQPAVVKQSLTTQPAYQGVTYQRTTRRGIFGRWRR